VVSGDFVGTQEAARLLGVSEASVRRWSDAGLIPSHRVGRRRERRFARSDVLDLKSAGRHGRSGSAPEVVLEGSAIPLHSHLSSFYTSDRGRLRLGLPFLRDGLVAGQSCVLMGNQGVARIYEGELKTEGVSADRALASGRLQLLNPSRTCEEGLETLERCFSAITRRGGVVIRLLGEAMQVRKEMGSMADFHRFEDALTPLVSRFPVVILCQYDARLLDGPALVTALKGHADNFNHQLGMFLN
jgi:transcriptional repressor of dcmA and dcmR